MITIIFSNLFSLIIDESTYVNKFTNIGTLALQWNILQAQFIFYKDETLSVLL